MMLGRFHQDTMGGKTRRRRYEGVSRIVDPRLGESVHHHLSHSHSRIVAVTEADGRCHSEPLCAPILDAYVNLVHA